MSFSVENGNLVLGPNGSSTTIQQSSTANRTLTLPDITCTLICQNSTDTLTNKTFTDSTTYFQDDADNTKKLQFQLSGLTTATTRTLTVPDISDTLVTLTAPQTLTNKIITSTLLNVDNLTLDSNTISSTNTNGSINIIPNGTGEVLLKADPISALGAATKQYADALGSAAANGSKGKIQFRGTATGSFASSTNFNWDDVKNSLQIGPSTNTGLNNNPIDIGDIVNSWLQFNIQNQSTGTSASSDLVATADNGNDNTKYIDVGINNSAYNVAAYSSGGPNDGYILVNGGGLALITETTNDITFFTNGATTNELRATIPSVGGFIIGKGALSTSSTDGFLYIAGSAGTPTGIPTSYTGRAPITIDTSNNIFYFYTNGSWRSATAPAGATTQVQYNNAGALAGASKLTIDSSDGFAILGEDSGTPPSAPVNGSKLFSRVKAGRNMSAQIGPSGVEYSFQPSIFANKISWWTAQGNSTTVAIINFGNTATGTATTRNVATTNIFTSLRRIGYVSATTAGSSAGTRHGAQQFWMGNAAGLGGFFYVARFGLSSASSVATQRSFVGLIAATTVLSNADPSTQLNILGFGVDSADSTWTFMHNDGSGIATKDALTGTFPPRDLSVSMFEARIFCRPNTTTIYYSLEVLNGGSLYEGSTTTNIPASTTLLSPQIWTNNGTTALACGIDVVSQYIETDN